MVTRSVALLVGTRKGLYMFRGGAARKRWRAEGPFFPGEPVYHAAFDPRDGASLYAACNATWGGPRIQVSRDLGRTWTVAGNPAFSDDASLTLKRTWHIEPGHATQPNVVWAGTEPAALFRSVDRGMTWTHVGSLRAHAKEHAWSPGAGGEGLHSIALDPEDPKKLAIGISVVGVYESHDGGATWTLSNEGTRTPLPVPKESQVGRCVHHLLGHPKTPGVRFQQNHVGTYWRAGGDARWREVTTGLPSDFGFAAALHPHDAATAFVVPLEVPGRTTPLPGAAVYRTTDCGESWRRLATGLPRGSRLEVLREGLTTDHFDPVGVYFGTTNGEVWASANEGRSWARVAAYLPTVLSVTAATLA